MKIELEGTSEEVFGMLRALAGGVVDNVAMVSGIPLTPIASAIAPVACPQSFEDLVQMWAEGFDVTGKAHWESNAPINPEKGDKLREVAISRGAGKLLKWIESTGGLTHAVQSILDDKTLSRLVAVNMAQVASVLFNDLALLLEHFDPFEDE